VKSQNLPQEKYLDISGTETVACAQLAARGLPFARLVAVSNVSQNAIADSRCPVWQTAADASVQSV
jgi:hypothetical protein